MEQAHFEQAVDRLKEVNGVIEELDERIRAEAFEVLKPYVLNGLPTGATRPPTPPGGAATGGPSGPSTTHEGEKHAGEGNVGEGSLREFMAEHENHEKPSDNVYAIAAWWYAQYGLAPISKATIDALAASIGVTVSTRSDKTLQNSAVSGKKNFYKKGSGFVPKPDGEKWLRETYGVRKGTKTPPDDPGDA